MGQTLLCAQIGPLAGWPCALVLVPLPSLSAPTTVWCRLPMLRRNSPLRRGAQAGAPPLLEAHYSRQWALRVPRTCDTGRTASVQRGFCWRMCSPTCCCLCAGHRGPSAVPQVGHPKRARAEGAVGHSPSQCHLIATVCTSRIRGNDDGLALNMAQHHPANLQCLTCGRPSTLYRPRCPSHSVHRIPCPGTAARCPTELSHCTLGCAGSTPCQSSGHLRGAGLRPGARRRTAPSRANIDGAWHWADCDRNSVILPDTSGMSEGHPLSPGAHTTAPFVSGIMGFAVPYFYWSSDRRICWCSITDGGIYGPEIESKRDAS